MHVTSLRKVGASVMLAVPPAILDLLHLNAGNMVGLSVDDERLVVQPQPRLRYTLDELLAQCDLSAEPDAQDRDWLDAPALASELIRWTGGKFTSCHSIRLRAMNSKEPAQC